MAAIQTNMLCKKFSDTLAIKDLNLQVGAGEIFCLLGQNGAGKTTTINLLMGFTEPTSGEALVWGKLPGSPSQSGGPVVSYIPEVVQLYPLLSGLENLDFFSRLAGVKLAKSLVKDKLLAAGLQEDAIDRRVGKYSKGMRQKVGIAIALATGAKVILMDEPTSGLDPKATAEFTGLVKQLAEKGYTIFMATHDIFNAVQIAHRIGIMKEGNLIHTLPVSAVNAESLQQLYLETV